MRKKLDTRFPAARIKKIMQADEDVGKIAMAVPVLVSKALELFLQDVCDRTYDITLQRGAKTMSSLHLKHCINSFSMFDFLKDIVSKVPDYGHSDASGDNHVAIKRRKSAIDEHHESDEELKKSRMQEMSHVSGSGRGKGRGCGRGRGRGRPPLERDPAQHHEMDSEQSTSFEPGHKPCPILVPNIDDDEPSKDLMKESPIVGHAGDPVTRNFDLNAEVADNQGAAAPTTAPPCQPAENAEMTEPPPSETKNEGLVSEVDGMAIDPHQIEEFNSRIEDYEDYDEE